MLDTSVVIALEELDAARLPIEAAISAITMAELAAGPHAAADAAERGRRQDRLQRAEAAFASIPFTTDAARAYGRLFSSMLAAGRTSRGARAEVIVV